MDKDVDLKGKKKYFLVWLLILKSKSLTVIGDDRLTTSCNQPNDSFIQPMQSFHIIPPIRFPVNIHWQCGTGFHWLHHITIRWINHIPMRQIWITGSTLKFFIWSIVPPPFLSNCNELVAPPPFLLQFFVICTDAIQQQGE